MLLPSPKENKLDEQVGYKLPACPSTTGFGLTVIEMIFSTFSTGVNILTNDTSALFFFAPPFQYDKCVYTFVSDSFWPIGTKMNEVDRKSSRVANIAVVKRLIPPLQLME